MDILISLGIFVVLILLGWIFGTRQEKMHFRELEERERRVAYMLASDIQTYPAGLTPGTMPSLVMGTAVISTDYLKTYIAKLKKVLGGEVRSYETLLDRARREALVRMLEQAGREGFDAVCNIRLDGVDVGGRGGVIMAGIFATGTAYRTAGEAGGPDTRASSTP